MLNIVSLTGSRQASGCVLTDCVDWASPGEHLCGIIQARLIEVGRLTPDVGGARGTNSWPDLSDV